MYNLERFINAQKSVHSSVVRELKNGQKESHWMWYIFPQYVGLGHSPTSYEYAIKSRDEAVAYLENDYLRENLYELCGILLTLDKSAYDIFGDPDCYKLKSSMTLFDLVKPNDIFAEVLEKFYGGQGCQRTLKLMNSK